MARSSHTLQLGFESDLRHGVSTRQSTVHACEETFRNRSTLLETPLDGCINQYVDGACYDAFLLQDRLLNEDEKAAFRQINTALGPELDDFEEESHHRASSPCKLCWSRLAGCVLDKSTLSVFAMAVVVVVGTALLLVSRSSEVFPEQGNVSHILTHVSTFVISAGVFGCMGGIANIIALYLLFYRIKFCYGTG